eukprot:2340366-Pyramimonas_sp.AAC.1
MPPQKTAVLLAKGADGAAAACPGLGSSHGRLAHPDFEPTPLTTQILSLTLLLCQWNVSRPDS